MQTLDHFCTKTITTDVKETSDTVNRWIRKYSLFGPHMGESFQDYS